MEKEAEKGVMDLYEPMNTKNYQQPPVASRDVWKKFAIRASRRKPYSHLDLELWLLRTMRK